VTGGFGSGDTITVTSRSKDGQTILSYIPNGNATTVTVAMSKISSSTNLTKCWWFNPSSGTASLIGSYPNSGVMTFTPPDSGDWVLVIDDSSANLSAPGSADL
jgi:Putative collagen-binding domain of a collagenase